MLQREKSRTYRRGTAVNIILLCLTVIWLFFLFSNSLKTAADSSDDSGRLLSLLRNIFPGITDHLVRKAAHFVEFLLLGVLSSLTVLLRVKMKGGKLPSAAFPAFGWLTSFGLLSAIADETLQYFSPGRSPEVIDVVIDFAGFAAGTAAATAVFCLVNRKK